ncbi:hypothetical protein BD289DRAFT_380093 [Coniella lustricola]|uniref:Uncharacterized protein n=1 Tax=Coniella lustricola TaxID=2025994 RepID=A0A2T2ZRT5_9PEZI|nr:hypothetical protein BD289DRAFT_380093 [Coniella lustricola]
MSGDYYDPTPVVNVDVAVATTLATSTTAAAAAAVTTTTAAAAVAAAATTAAAAASSTASASSSSAAGLTSYVSFEDNCSSASSKRATVAEIAQVGNTGSEDGAYGCNYIQVATQDVAEQYDNYAVFYGATEDMTCYYWNKIAKDGSIAGWYTSTDSFFSFDLAAGSTQYLAIQNGTGGAGTCQPASLAPVTDANSALLYTWIEWDAVDVTTTWSAFDVSSIMAQDADGTVNGVEACTLDGTTCSSISAGAATISNAFDLSLAAADGIGYNTGGTLKFKINLGF